MTESTDRWQFLFFNAKTKQKKNNSLLLTEKKNNTAALIEINLYSVLFLYLFIQFLEYSFLLNMSIAPENKARFVLFVMCIFILIKIKQWQGFYLRPLWPISSILLLFGYPERICLYKEMILAALLRQNSKTNMTKNRDKIVKYFCHIAHPYCIFSNALLYINEGNDEIISTVINSITGEAEQSVQVIFKAENIPLKYYWSRKNP